MTPSSSAKTRISPKKRHWRFSPPLPTKRKHFHINNPSVISATAAIPASVFKQWKCLLVVKLSIKWRHINTWHKHDVKSGYIYSPTPVNRHPHLLHNKVYCINVTTKWLMSQCTCESAPRWMNQCLSTSRLHLSDARVLNIFRKHHLAITTDIDTLLLFNNDILSI